MAELNAGDFDINLTGFTDKQIDNMLADFNVTEVKEDNFDPAAADFFGGSGSTLMAAEQTDRAAYLMEIDPVYCDVIIQRYIKYKSVSDNVFLVRDEQLVLYKDLV
ncbi:hypothetical protein SDC9_188595 [bioreactor metagenome]|uniref:DNA methylase N-4/N-6 domain-containing protein n=1 Tax=bioreactor metagenome TaxID=1076179 RepID=A0A645HPR6_9ZZZZ